MLLVFIRPPEREKSLSLKTSDPLRSSCAQLSCDKATVKAFDGSVSMFKAKNTLTDQVPRFCE